MFIQCDACQLPLANDSVHLILGSPPYCDARTYGIGIRYRVEQWIEFMLTVTRESLRVCKGPVLWVCAGVTRGRNYWPACEGLAYRAWEEGIQSYRPAYWFKNGIPGSGGTDWLKACVEYILCFKRPGPLPYFDVSAIGHKPKWGPGGEMSHRLRDGAKVNQWRGHKQQSAPRDKNGKRQKAGKPSHRYADHPVVYANPGNLFTVPVGGGLLGSKLAHKNEAPFPEKLVAPFIQGWTHPGDVVLDPFSGSGTTVSVARQFGRVGIGLDIRFDSCTLSRNRAANQQTRFA